MGNRSNLIPSSAWKKAFKLLEAVNAAGNTKEFINILLEYCANLVQYECAVYFPIDQTTRAPSTTGYININIPKGDEIGEQYGSYYYQLDPVKELGLVSSTNQALSVSPSAVRRVTSLQPLGAAPGSPPGR